MSIPGALRAQVPVKGMAVDCAAHGEPFCIIFWPDVRGSAQLAGRRSWHPRHAGVALVSLACLGISGGSLSTFTRLLGFPPQMLLQSGIGIEAEVSGLTGEGHRLARVCMRVLKSRLSMAR